MGDCSFTERDAYQRLDLRIDLVSETWSVTLFGHDLTDEAYLEAVITAPNSAARSSIRAISAGSASN